MLTADLDVVAKPLIEPHANSPFFYVADGRPVGLSPVAGEVLLGVYAGSDLDLAALLSDATASFLDPWYRDVHVLSKNLVSLRVSPSVDWNNVLAEYVTPLAIENSLPLDALWSAPVLVNAESGLRQWVTDEVIMRLEPQVEPDRFFADAMFAGYRNLSGTTDQFVATLRNATGLEALELSNQILPNRPGVVWSTVNFVAEVERDFIPNDPLFLSQWHLNSLGFPFSVKFDADIDAVEAWDVVTGDAGVVVAIIDDGIQTNHPDLAMWTNLNESGTPNGLDNDGNGWVDDINGLNLVDAGTTSDNPNLNNPNPSHSNENHGTAVAGSAAARGHNSLGVASPAFGTRIMALKPFACTTPNGGCTTSFESVAKTVYYAAGRTANGSGTWRGADVINISYSMSPNTVDTTAFNWATTNGRNGLGTSVFASTGNKASGAEFARVNISVPTSVSPGAQVQFRYSKDGSVSSGDDRVWINWARFPNGAVERFDNVAGPSGWVGAGNLNWDWQTSPPETERAHGTGRYPMRSGPITHNQTSSMITPEFDSSGGFDFRYWISSEADFDKLEVLVRYRDFFGSWGSWTESSFTTWDNNGNPVSNSNASGIAEFTPNAAYPANLASVIGVGASTDWDYKAGYSQYGTGLDFVAPSGGGSIDFWTTDRTGSGGYNNSSDYATVSGTSFAAPLAAGVGALMLSRNPELTAAQLRTMMQNTAEEIGSVSYPGGANEFYGHGRINAHGAVLAAGVDSNDRISNATFVSMNSTRNGRLTTTTDIDMYRISVSAGQRISIDVDHYATDFETDTFLRLFDASGNVLASSDDSAGPTPEFSNREAYLEHTFTGSGNYYVGVSSFGNSSYNPVDGSGKTAVPITRLGNYQLYVNNVSAQMLSVNTNSDTGDGKYFNGITLRESIAFANQNPGSVIQFDTAGLFSVAQTINLTGGQGQLQISQSMTIDGANRVNVNAQNNSRVFLVDDGNNSQLKNVQITGMTITGGTGNGAGIFNRENLTIARSTITGNAGINGGGVYAERGSLTIVDSALVNNNASRGGGLFVRNVSADNTIVRNSTVSGNSAGIGGGIENYFDNLFIENSTITNNQAPNGAGVRTWGTPGYAETIVNNSIIAGNSGPDVQVNGANNFTSLGYNLVGTGNAVGDFNVVGDTVGLNPQLGPLQNNGGPTLTHALLPGSPAINRGNPNLASPPEFDQRGTGFPRIRGGIADIGAYEANPPVVDVVGTIAQPSTTQRNYHLRNSEVVFYQFTLTSPVQASSDQFLVIDTIGSTLSPDNNTEIGLYDSSGNRIANNDDYSSLGFLSRLGFGATSDSFGDLLTGTYYLAVAAFNSNFGISDFNAISSSGLTGDLQVNIALGTTATVTGDFDNNNVWDIADLNALVEAIVAGTDDPAFDMNGNGLVNLADINDVAVGWLVVGGANNVPLTGGNPFLPGDANLDGVVDGQDFIAWNSNKFTNNIAWSSGNFNADSFVDGQDFIIWNGNKFQTSMTPQGAPSSPAPPSDIRDRALASLDVQRHAMVDRGIDEPWFKQSDQDEWQQHRLLDSVFKNWS